MLAVGRRTRSACTDHSFPVGIFEDVMYHVFKNPGKLEPLLMTTSSDNPSKLSSLGNWHGWKPLIVTLSLSAAGVAAVLIWHEQPESPSKPAENLPLRTKSLPMPPDPERPLIVLKSGQEKRFYFIRNRDQGDEMIVDFQTGKLLSVRDSQGTLVWEAPKVQVDERPPTDPSPVEPGGHLK
jgi:hypothetical protein